MNELLCSYFLSCSDGQASGVMPEAIIAMLFIFWALWAIAFILVDDDPWVSNMGIAIFPAAFCVGLVVVVTELVIQVAAGNTLLTFIAIGIILVVVLSSIASKAKGLRK